MNEREELIQKLSEIAEASRETEPNAAIVLYTLCGTLNAGSDNELAEIVIDFARSERIRLLAGL